jgi:hypothetical protein
MTLVLRWEATGVISALFPVLDADISLTPAGQQGILLAPAGSYRAPLGGLGAGLDKAILNRVATATIRALLRNVADTTASPAAQRQDRQASQRSRTTAVHRTRDAVIAAWPGRFRRGAFRVMSSRRERRR